MSSALTAPTGVHPSKKVPVEAVSRGYEIFSYPAVATAGLSSRTADGTLPGRGSLDRGGHAGSILFPKLGALAHNVSRQPRDTWAKVPGRFVLTPLLTGLAGTILVLVDCND